MSLHGELVARDKIRKKKNVHRICYIILCVRRDMDGHASDRNGIRQIKWI